MSDMQVATDFTAVSEAVNLFTRSQVRSELVVKQRPARQLAETLFVDSPAVRMNRANTVTSTMEEIGKQTQPVAATNSPASVSPIDPVCKSRTALLVRKYTGNASVEDNARFDILTMRLRKLDPRVSSEQFETLDHMITELEHSSTELDEIEHLLAGL